MGSDDLSEVAPEYIVYVMDEDAHILPYFLEVCDSREEAQAEMDRWWNAFENGEKAKPSNYGGLSFGHVSEFERWQDAE